MYPTTQSPQGECSTEETTSEPVATEPQGSAGESPDLSLHISNCDCSYCKTERKRIRDAIRANLRPCGHLRLFQFTASGQYADIDVCQCCEIARLTRDLAHANYLVGHSNASIRAREEEIDRLTRELGEVHEDRNVHLQAKYAVIVERDQLRAALKQSDSVAIAAQNQGVHLMRERDRLTAIESRLDVAICLHLSVDPDGPGDCTDRLVAAVESTGVELRALSEALQIANADAVNEHARAKTNAEECLRLSDALKRLEPEVSPRGMAIILSTLSKSAAPQWEACERAGPEVSHQPPERQCDTVGGCPELNQLRRIDQAARAFVNAIPESMTFAGAQRAFAVLCDALFDPDSVYPTLSQQLAERGFRKREPLPNDDPENLLAREQLLEFSRLILAGTTKDGVYNGRSPDELWNELVCGPGDEHVK